MEIIKNFTDKQLEIKLTGRLDTGSSPNLEAELKTVLDDAEEVIFDLVALEYISSAGLRVLLSTQKAMNKKGGTMKLRNVNNEILEIFEITGFVDILTIE